MDTFKLGCGKLFPILVFFIFLVFCSNAESIPENPSLVELEVLSGESLEVTFDPPLSDGGDPIQTYKVLRNASVQ